MDWQLAIGITAAIVNLWASVDYLKEAVFGDARPERSAMIIWFVTTSTIVATSLAEGADESMWFVWSDFAVVCIMLIAAIKYGYGWVARRDYLGLVVASLGILVWQNTDVTFIAISAAIFVDAVGITLVSLKALEAPKTEPLKPWLLYTIAGVLAAISVGGIDLELLAFPIYVVLSGLVLIASIKIGEKRALITAKMKHK